MFSVLGLPLLPKIFYEEAAEAPTTSQDNPLGLPMIGKPIDAVRPRIADSTNPGTSNPTAHTQVRPLSVDQTMGATPSSAPLHNSDGQVQHLDLSAGQRGVTVSTGLVPLVNSDGSTQIPWIAPVSAGQPGGLPAESRPDSQNLTMHTISTSVARPIAKDVNADQQKPGKLPKSHNIK